MDRENQQKDNLIFSDMRYFLFSLARNVSGFMSGKDIDTTNIPSILYDEVEKERNNPEYLQEKLKRNEEIRKLRIVENEMKLKKHSNFIKK